MCRKFSFLAAVLTFVVGVAAASVWVHRRAQRVEAPEASAPARASESRDAQPAAAAAVVWQAAAETPEAKAVRLAEEFVARNGYTSLPPEKDKLSYESIEWSEDVDKILESRRDTLERKAYGVRHMGRMGDEGWTVIFRPTRRHAEFKPTWGRAVTMDKDFENLRVEHKSIWLDAAEKKF